MPRFRNCQATGKGNDASVTREADIGAKLLLLRYVAVSIDKQVRSANTKEDRAHHRARVVCARRKAHLHPVSSRSVSACTPPQDQNHY